MLVVATLLAVFEGGCGMGFSFVRILMVFQEPDIKSVCVGLAFLGMNSPGQGVYLVLRAPFVVDRMVAFTVWARRDLAGA
jgi:hypothetical protein